MKYYITTPIYYINDVPHIGHAYTTIAADVLARYHRTKGDDVFFLTGTDEHGAKIAEAADKAGKSPKEFVDHLRPKFIDTWKELNISYDQFFATTNPDHEKMVQDFVAKLVEKGFVEKREYEGLYCVGCERFLKESELVDGMCPDHKKAPVKQKEENYFFKLSSFQDKLAKLIENDEFEIGPAQRKNEILGKLKQGLEDVSISRAAVEWGVSFPGDPKQTIYVWIDALLNYYTATEIYCHDSHLGGAGTPSTPEVNSDAGAGTPSTPEVDACGAWPANLHLMAKDILWFHAVIWPAMLLAADLSLPKKVFAHGFFTVNGQKMSKTIGNVIDPNEIVDKYGADAVRFYLLSAFPFGEDGDVSLEKLDQSYNKLANEVGNLAQRTLSMIVRYEIPKSKLQISNQNSNSKIQIDEELCNLQFMEALRKIMAFAEEQNRFIADKAPWTLAKEGKNEELAEVLSTVYSNLGVIADALLPFIPETAEKMKNQLETLKPEPLFPKTTEYR